MEELSTAKENDNGQVAIGPDSGSDALMALTSIVGPPPASTEESKASGRWEPLALRPRHREIMRRLLEGASYVEIAEDMGITPQSIMLVATSRMFREELAKLEAELDYKVQQRAEDLSNEALDKLKVLMRKAKSQALQISCADKILGIAGYSKIERKIVGVVSGEDVIKELNRRKREQVLGTNGNTPVNSGTGNTDSPATEADSTRISLG